MKIRIICCLCFLICGIASCANLAFANNISLYQSIEKAIDHSSQLSALSHNQEAFKHDLKQAYSQYYPSVDLLLGYGLEQHSDTATRESGSDPSDSDWDPTSEVTLKVSQRIFDWGETGQNVAIHKSRLSVADYQAREATLSITMDAIAAHIDVYRQGQLIKLAENNLEFHREIYHSLFEMEQAGAGNAADLAQTQARMANAQSRLLVVQSEYNRAVINYTRVTGEKPGKLDGAAFPASMPASLENALKLMEEKNPSLLVYDARVNEADARLGLSKAMDKPKINLELSSSYQDQSEGDSSWQQTNDVMLVLKWNLFSGGKYRQQKMASLARKHSRKEDRKDKLEELTEMMSSAWITFESLASQKKILSEAKAFSQDTFDMYAKQFNVSKRSLLDLLSAKNEYFQSSRQLIDVTVDHTMAAYGILLLSGDFQIVE